MVIWLIGRHTARLSVILQGRHLDQTLFATLGTGEKAVFEAYLKRFAAIQDYLGAKAFPLALESKGIVVLKMSEVLSRVEQEGIIEIDSWLRLRQLRNTLEHEYPDELEATLGDLASALSLAGELESVVLRLISFIKAG